MSNDAVPPVDEISPASKEGHDWVVNIDDLLVSIEARQKIKEKPPEEPEFKKIPSIYGNWKFSKHFLPETIRWKFAAIMKSSFDLNVRSFLEKFQENEDDIWRCYDGFDEQFLAVNRKRFIENLLANSGFLIFAMVTLNDHYYSKLFQILYRFNDSTKDQRINECAYLRWFISNEQMEIQRYMLTMENQIPLIVVDAVYKNSNLSSELPPIHKLAISCFEGIHPGVHKSKLPITDHPELEFQHLLHIFHWSRTPREKFNKIHGWFPMKMDRFYIPSATALQLSGTVFKRHAASGIDVSFNKTILSGVMQLPNRSHFQYIDDIYEQLLAFEQGYGMVCGFSVTAHIACILCLAKTEEDVKLLRAKYFIPRIDDKDVLSSLECYKTNVLSNAIPMSIDLSYLMSNVKSHHDKNTDKHIKKHYADFKRRYCSSPWITISVVGGILLFVLTFIQTIYSALSYNKQ